MRLSTFHARGQGTRQLSSSVSDSAFRWEPRVGPVALIDAYEGGHGVTDVNPPGSEAVNPALGSVSDQASLQRYPVSISYWRPDVWLSAQADVFSYERSQTTSLELL